MEQIMKTNLKYGIASYSGTIDDITFGSYKKGKVCIARKWVLPRTTAQNAELGTSTKNIASIYAAASAGFKSDLRTYADLYARKNSRSRSLAANPFALFMKLMYAFAADEGESVDLKTITLNDIQSLFSDLDSVAAAVTAGYLPNVNGAELLTQTI